MRYSAYELAATSARSRPSLSRSARSASTFCVVSDTAQNIPATFPVSSRAGEYEKVNQVCSSNPLRFITRGRSSRYVAWPAIAASISGLMSGQISDQIS